MWSSTKVELSSTSLQRHKRLLGKKGGSSSLMYSAFLQQILSNCKTCTRRKVSFIDSAAISTRTKFRKKKKTLSCLRHLAALGKNDSKYFCPICTLIQIGSTRLASRSNLYLCVLLVYFRPIGKIKSSSNRAAKSFSFSPQHAASKSRERESSKIRRLHSPMIHFQRRVSCSGFPDSHTHVPREIFGSFLGLFLC